MLLYIHPFRANLQHGFRENKLLQQDILLQYSHKAFIRCLDTCPTVWDNLTGGANETFVCRGTRLHKCWMCMTKTSPTTFRLVKSVCWHLWHKPIVKKCIAVESRSETRRRLPATERTVMMAAERSRLFDRLKKGLEEGIAHERGERILRVTEVVVPDPPQSYGAEDVRRIRTRMRMSQAGFALLLQVSNKTVQSWEQGTRRPQQSSARLLQFIEHPDLLISIAANE